MSDRVAGAEPVSHSRARKRALGQIVAWVLVAMGVFACVLTVLGLDGANEQQKSDFELYYLLAMQEFAADPFSAIYSYSAAPTPLYYIIQGGVLSLLGDPLYVRIVSGLLGVAVLVAVWTFPAARSYRIAALAVLLICPYFRGQVWFANADVLTILITLVVLRPTPAIGGRWIGPIVLAAVSVYVRQTYAFLPLYMYVRGLFRDKRPVLLLTAVCALTALPMLWLIYIWGGIAPPRYKGHLSLSDIPAAVAVGMTITAVYLLPLLAVRALKPSRLINDLKSLPLWVHAVILCAAAILAIWNDGFLNIQGGGLVFLAAEAGEKVTGIPLLVTFMPAFVGACYAMALMLKANLWSNSVVLAATLAMSISVMIYQRYFDPLIPLLLLLVIRSPELKWLEQRGLIWTAILPSALIAVAASLTHSH